MRPIRHLILLLPLAALLVWSGWWVGVASARAVQFDTPLKPCYVSVDQDTREPIDVNASGFRIGATVDIAIDGVGVLKATAFDGTITGGTVAAPFQDSGQRPFTLTLTEEGAPANTVSTTSKVTALSLRVKPKRSDPRKKVRFIGRGFTGGLPVFAHYVFGGKLRKTVKFGLPHGDCGRFSVKRRQIPIKQPRAGRWTVQADTVRKYAPDPGVVLVRLAITVKRVLGHGAR